MPKPNPTLVDGLLQLSFLLYGRLGRAAAAHQLSLIQVRLLGILRDREPGMNDLAEQLELSKSSLSGLVDRAETRGLVARVPSSDDRRVATVKATALGLKLARKIADEVGAEVDALVEVLPEADRKRLASLVGKLVESDQLEEVADQVASK